MRSLLNEKITFQLWTIEREIFMWMLFRKPFSKQHRELLPPKKDTSKEGFQTLTKQIYFWLNASATQNIVYSKNTFCFFFLLDQLLWYWNPKFSLSQMLSLSHKKWKIRREGKKWLWKSAQERKVSKNTKTRKEKNDCVVKWKRKEEQERQSERETHTKSNHKTKTCAFAFAL